MKSVELSYRDIVEILRIFESSGLSHLTIETGTFKLSIARDHAGTEATPATAQTTVVAQPASPPAPAPEPAAPAPSPATAAPSLNVGGRERSVVKPQEPVAVSPTAVVVTAPLLGVFFRAPSPEAPPYVEVGQRVQSGDTLCLVESMKMFMPIQAPADGTVTAILAENAALVEFGQALFAIEPDQGA